MTFVGPRIGNCAKNAPLALAVLMLSPAAEAQTLGTAQSLAVPTLRIVAVVGICLLIALVAILVIRQRYGIGPTPSGLLSRFVVSARPLDRIIVREMRRLSPHGDVCRFSCAGRDYLVILSSGGAVLLQDSASSSGSPPHEPQP